MARNYSSPLTLNVEHISDKVEQTIDFIEKRYKGEISSLKTGLNKLDKALLNGLD